MNSIPETMTAEGAHLIREKIKAYWAGRGFRTPNLFTVRATSPVAGSARFDVRSNMVGGWPQ